MASSSGDWRMTQLTTAFWKTADAQMMDICFMN
jgi:hypothetical protein